MRACCVLVSLLSAAALAGCTRDISLPPLPAADKVVLGELGKPEPGGELTDARVVQAALDFANARRRGGWSAAKVEHASCGTVLLTFRAQGRPVGYLALDGERLFTNAPGGEVVQAATADTVAAFAALLPRWYERSRCVG